MKFIQSFSRIGHQITSLPKEGVKFSWTSECATSFEQPCNKCPHLKDCGSNQGLLSLYSFLQGRT